MLSLRLRLRLVVVSRFSLHLSFPSAVCLCKMSTAPAGPLTPKFVPVEQSSITPVSKPDGLKFSVVSYNILAQGRADLESSHPHPTFGTETHAYVKSAFFPHSPASCLKWKTRSQAVLSVLKNLGSDFLCLQEVDEYDSFYKSNLEDIGYSSIYIQRTGKKRDGCGIFYRNNSAELVLEEKIDYNDLVNSVKDSLSPAVNKDGDSELEGGTSGTESETVKKAQEDRGDPNDPHVRFKRDCVGIMAAFKLKDPLCQHVIIANTHIYWDPEWADVKLAQAKYLLSRLSKFNTTVSNKLDCMPPIIVCGDFNSTPGDQVYQYIVSGSSSANVAEDSDESPLPLCSFYASVRGEPPFTNCTPDFTGTLDYIFFSSATGDIKPLSYVQLPEPESSDVTGGLPNHYHPSDHLPIGAEFEFL